jgi:hypothetical protein
MEGTGLARQHSLYYSRDIYLSRQASVFTSQINGFLFSSVLFSSVFLPLKNDIIVLLFLAEDDTTIELLRLAVKERFDFVLVELLIFPVADDDEVAALKKLVIVLRSAVAHC